MDVNAVLDRVATELRGRWESALESGDFDAIMRLVEATHAVHRAITALTPDSIVVPR